MLDYNEIKPRKYIIHDNDPWEVLTSEVSRKQANKPVNRTKIKNLISGRTVEHTFHSSDRVHEADMERRDVLYLYANKGEYWFCDPEDRGDRFQLDEKTVVNELQYVRENDTVNALVFNDDVIGLKLPIKVELKVAEAPPNVKGNTAQGGSKSVVLETGLVVTAPLFIEVGDILRINTEEGTYVERVSKA